MLVWVIKVNVCEASRVLSTDCMFRARRSTRLWAPQATLGGNRSGHNVIQDTERNVSQKRAIKAYLEIENYIFDSIIEWVYTIRNLLLKNDF